VLDLINARISQQIWFTNCTSYLIFFFFLIHVFLFTFLLDFSSSLSHHFSSYVLLAVLSISAFTNFLFPFTSLSLSQHTHATARACPRFRFGTILSLSLSLPLL
jgi:hypothetical protein